MTLAADARPDDAAPTLRLTSAPQTSQLSAHDDRPVEFWPTAAIKAAVDSGDLTIWQRIAAAIKRDPYGRTARQVEEVLESTSSYGITNALDEVLVRSREHLEADERAEVGRHVQLLLDRSGLGQQEFASRIGVSAEELTSYLNGDVSPSAVQMVRMRRLSDRFAKMRAQRATQPE
ncbi:MAG: helix-turn-helix transcriptional regulator [Mycolicibacterium sp.]|nr:helix-turn-helix transcriptional regulator [Mycolicibacterium sp.]